ncbi:MAG TPA: AtpZ/AtpI family protein [Pseudonocardiaceae bacterium]
MSRPSGPELSTLLGLGITIAVILVAGIGLGWLLDEVLNTLPVFLMIGLALGITGAGGYVYVQFKKLM